jgi:AmiR/NasT family two-component response regulator
MSFQPPLFLERRLPVESPCDAVADAVARFKGSGVGAMDTGQHLRVLIANEREDRLALLDAVVVEMGHEVVAHETDVSRVAALTARLRPDLALVGLGLSSEHALDLVSEIVRESYCPVIAILSAKNSEWVNEAATRGLFAAIVDGHPDELQSAIDTTVRRFAEQQRLRGLFEGREAEAVREREVVELRQRQALEVHESVVQSLAVAKLSIDLGRVDESRVAIREALEAAQAIVARSLEELKQRGIPAGQLIRDASSQADG